jgi:DNA-binding MarR family transcriptional regulator
MLIIFIYFVNYLLNMSVESINWLKDSKYRVEVLKLLSNNSYISSELADKLSINRASMSRILKKLKEKKFVKGISGNSRTTSYIITDLGKNALGELTNGTRRSN